jgi:tetratricopeptide (TPR) repeat protein
VYVDVVGVSQQQARDALLGGVSVKRGKPAVAPGFPAVQAGERVRGAAIFNVPVMTRTFVGRERALEQLAAGLSGDGAVAVTQVDAIHGLGGVGKTQLAARYARTRRDAYDVIWWLRAEQPATLRADLAALAVALGLVDVDVEERDAVTAARDWLERNHRWLLVFDNATSAGAIAELVPEDDGGHVLITSRAHADWRSLGARPVALDVWEREESVTFLIARTEERDRRDALDELADALGDLPLALEQAAAYIATKAITATGYLGRLGDRAPELLDAGRPPGYEHTIATVWKLAFTELAHQPVATQLVGVCAHLAPERIPRELLDAYSDIGDDTPPVSARAVDDAIELLLAYALLTVTADGTLGMHRLVQDVARRTAGPQLCAAATTRTVALIDRVLPDRPWEHEQWPVCGRLLAHAVTATQHARSATLAAGQTADVLIRVAQYLRERAQYTPAREHAEHAIALYEHQDPIDAARLANALDILGTILRSLAQLQAARDMLQRALATATTVHGPEHRDVARTLVNLANVQQQLGEFEAARASLQRALAIKKAVDGPEHPEVMITLGNLGSVQRQLGEFEAARATLDRVLGMFEAVYGPEHPEVARTLNNLGLVQEQLGELEAARASQQRALAIEEAVYGSEHPEVASTLVNLGIVQQQLGEFKAARASQQRALAIQEAVYGPEHPDVAMTLGNLGLLQQQLGEFEAARASQQRALAIEEAVYGPEHPEVASTLNNLGLVQAQLGERAAARACAQRAVAIFERSLGSEHPNTALARALLASVSSGANAAATAPASAARRWPRLRRGR